MNYLREGLVNAKQWLMDSGIQNTDDSEPECGSINAWFDPELNKYSFAYSEITGYGITTLIFLNKVFHDPKLVERAVLAADWLQSSSTHNKIGGYRCRFDLEKKEFSPANVCSFDNAMCLNGFVNLYKETKKSKYLDEGIRIADFLIGTMQKPDGSFHTKYDGLTCEPVHSYKTWSTQSGSFHAKNALGLLNLFSITADRKYMESAIKIGELAMKMQQPDGRFVTHKQEGFTHAHPHCYSVEGIFAVGMLCGRKDFIQSAVKGAEFLKSMQLESGGISCFYDGNISMHERADALAQAIRLWIMGKKYGLEIEDKKIEAAASRLKSFQRRNNPRKEINGGFAYGYNEEGRKLEHANSWVTMFSLQALHMYEQSKTNSLDFDINLLI